MRPQCLGHSAQGLKKLQDRLPRTHAGLGVRGVVTKPWTAFCYYNSLACQNLNGLGFGRLPARKSQARSSLGPTPYTRHPTPYTRHTPPYTLHPTPYTPHTPPYTLNPTPFTPHPTHQDRHPRTHAGLGVQGVVAKP